MIHLEKVTYDNVVEVCKLRVKKEQKKFVASNKGSLIEAYLTLDMGRHVYPFAICLDKKVIGFLMVGYDIYDEGDPDFVKDNYCIWRFMIDKKYQGQGYGKEAFKQALDFIKSEPCGKANVCFLSYEPENEVAKNLYKKFGFVEIPEYYEEGDEMPAILKF